MILKFGFHLMSMGGVQSLPMELTTGGRGCKSKLFEVYLRPKPGGVKISPHLNGVLTRPYFKRRDQHFVESMKENVELKKRICGVH